MTHNNEQRLHALDAVRGFALLVGVAFHAALSFMPGWPPGIWAMVDNSPSQFLSDTAFVTHIFRMSLFFFIAGYFGRMLYHKLGAQQFWLNRAKRIAVPLVIGRNRTERVCLVVNAAHEESHRAPAPHSPSTLARRWYGQRHGPASSGLTSTGRMRE